jgi:hypothetical protein
MQLLSSQNTELTNLGNLYQIYEDLKGNIEPFAELYRLAKAAGMNPQDVNKLLTFANHHLPSLQSRYDDLKRKLSSLEGQIHNSTIHFKSYLTRYRIYIKRLTLFA